MTRSSCYPRLESRSDADRGHRHSGEDGAGITPGRLARIRAGFAGITKALGLAVAGTALALAAADNAEFMTGPSIERAVTGAHMRGKEDDVTWEEFFEPDGRIEGSWGGKPYSGAWWIEGDLLCLDYEGMTDDGCWLLSTAEDHRLLWFSRDGTPDPRRRDVWLVPE